METQELLQQAIEYHNALPARIREYLNARGIPDLLIDFHMLGWNGRRITIPILNREGGIAYFKLARDPADPDPGPKSLATRGATAEIYGWDQLLRRPHQIIICEGEFDRLVLEAKGFCAVTSTGGAGTFRPEWAAEFRDIPEVYVCYDNDQAGHAGAERVAGMVPQARIVQLPDEVGPGGDVTDFFVRLGRTRSDFEKLLDEAMPLPPPPPKESECRPPSSNQDPLFRDHIAEVKRRVPIESVISRYIRLNTYGRNPIALCPFHEEKNPSFTVFPETGTFHCFGCGKHGDVITFLQEIEHLNFTQAMKSLEQNIYPYEPEQQAGRSRPQPPESDPGGVDGV